MDNDAHFQSPQQSKFTRTRRQRSEVPEFLEREADLRVDAFPQRGADPDLVPDDSADEMEDGPQKLPSKLDSIPRGITRNSKHHPSSDIRIPVRGRKRGREEDNDIEEVLTSPREAKKSRREESNDAKNLDLDCATLTRRDLVSLDHALRRQWACLCQQCSGLSVRLSLPRCNKDLEAQTCFDVFFGVRRGFGTEFQEAVITVKNLQASTSRRPSEARDLGNLCQTITTALGRRDCLRFALQDGMLQSLHPKPMAFGSDRMSRSVSLSALFNHQQDLSGRQSILKTKGRRILAVVLASALLPLLGTPWLQSTLDCSKIRFFEPRREGELPDITKPFLALEHVPVTSARHGNSADASRHDFDHNNNVLALGILLCELHYCTPVERMAKDPHAVRNFKDAYYVCEDELSGLLVEAGEDYYLATKACLKWKDNVGEQDVGFDISAQQRFCKEVIKPLEDALSSVWRVGLADLVSLDSRQKGSCWGSDAQEFLRRHTGRISSSTASNTVTTDQRHPTANTTPMNYATFRPDLVPQVSAQPSSGSQAPRQSAEPSEKSLYFFDASHQTGCERDIALSKAWMDNLLSSVQSHIDPDSKHSKPVRIALLDSGLGDNNPFVDEAMRSKNGPIKACRSFVHGTNPQDCRDEFGHGTHALGLLHQVAPCAEIYVARIGRHATLDRSSYDDIAKAISHAVEVWRVDIISMSFGIREDHEPIYQELRNAMSKGTLLFAAASNDGANFGRAFPARCTGVFCIHSTDGHGNPSGFNPTASQVDMNFSLLGESVPSWWPFGAGGHEEVVRAMSGTSVATPIAAGLAALVLSLVRQQDQYVAREDEQLEPWLRRYDSMSAVFRSMVRGRRGGGYDYITPHLLFDQGSTREDVYRRVDEIRRTLYK